jgi:hypothetical protein
MVVVLGSPGSSRPPGGWKWIALGADSRKSRGAPARRHPEGAAERARERLDGVVAGLEAGLGDGGTAAQPPGGALEEQAAPEPRRRLADAGADQAVEVERAEHRPRRQRRAVEALVEGLEHGVDDVAQTIRAHRSHARSMPASAAVRMTGIAAALRPPDQVVSTAAPARGSCRDRPVCRPRPRSESSTGVPR